MDYSESLYSAQALIQSRVGYDPDLSIPKVGIVLGTGMGKLVEQVDNPIRIPFGEIPGFETSTIKGHTGELVVGTIGGISVAMLSGRNHFYEGYSRGQICFPVRCLCELGVRLLLVGNAAGGINPKFRSGEVMLIQDHLNLNFLDRCQAQITQPLDSTRKRRPATAVYTEKLIVLASEIARRNGFPLHQGVYAALTGPNYETRSEYRMLGRLGADVVGMSTIPEAITAAEYGVDVCGLSTITNLATPDVPQVASHDEVIEAVHKAEQTLAVLVRELILTTQGT